MLYVESSQNVNVLIRTHLNLILHCIEQPIWSPVCMFHNEVSKPAHSEFNKLILISVFEYYEAWGIYPCLTFVI